MTPAIVVFGIALMLFTLYIGKRQLDLFQRGLYNSYWNATLGRINKAIALSRDDDSRRELLAFKRVFKFYFAFFILYVIAFAAFCGYSWFGKGLHYVRYPDVISSEMKT